MAKVQTHQILWTRKCNFHTSSNLPHRPNKSLIYPLKCPSETPTFLSWLLDKLTCLLSNSDKPDRSQVKPSSKIISAEHKTKTCCSMLSGKEIP